MSLVVFPFKEETVAVVATNLKTAARHERIDEVWAVAAAENAAASEVREVAGEIEAAESKPVRVFPQRQMGRFRSGKGDGMNTAIAFAAELDFPRIHFYDADITNFGAGMTGAELSHEETKRLAPIGAAKLERVIRRYLRDRRWG